MTTATGLQGAAWDVGAAQADRLQERLDRQLAGAKREMVETLERTVEDLVQERVQIVRNQVLVNHTVFQKDVTSLQSAISDLRLHSVATGQGADEYRREALAAIDASRAQCIEHAQESLEALRNECRAELADAMTAAGTRLAAVADVASLREEVAGLTLRAQAGEFAVFELQKSLRAQCVDAADAREAAAAQAADAISALAPQLAELRASTDERLAELRSALDTSLSDNEKAQEKLLLQTKESLTAHVAAQLRELKEFATMRLDACDGLCNRCLCTIDVSLADFRNDFTKLASELRGELGGRVDVAETRMHCRAEEATAACQRVAELARSEASDEAASSRQRVENEELQAQQASTSERFTRQLESVIGKLEARQRAVHDEFRAAEERLQRRQGESEKKFSSSLQHLEDATAWVLRKVDEGQDVATSDFKACRVHQEDTTVRWRGLQEQVAQMYISHSSLEGQQAALDDRHRVLEESQAQQAKDLAQHSDRFSSDLQHARNDWDGKIAAAQQSLNALLEEVGTRLPLARREAQAPEASLVMAQEAVLAARGSEDKLAAILTASEQREVAQGELRRALEACTTELSEKVRACADGQQEQAGWAKELQAKVCQLESQSLVAFEQLRQDVVQRIANVRSQCRDEGGALEMRLQSCAALQENLASSQRSLSCQLEASEAHILAEHRHLTAEVGVSETKLLSDQRQVLDQVHELAKAQEARMQRQSTKANARHEETAAALREMRKAFVDATQQLLEDIAAEQAASVGSLREEIRDVEAVTISKSVSAAEAARQALSSELHLEVSAAQDLWQQLAATNDESVQQVQAGLEQVRREAEGLAEASAADVAQAVASSDLQACRVEVQISSLEQELGRFEHDACRRAQLESMTEVQACREACVAAFQRISVECSAMERTVLDEQRVTAERVSAAEKQALAEAQALRGEVLEEALATRANCRTNVEALRTELAATDTHVTTKVESLRNEVAAADEKFRTSAEGLRSELVAADTTFRRNAEGFQNELTERYAILSETVSSLETISSGSAIAAAAASAAVEVRGEVLELVTHLRQRLEATDEQLLFIRTEVAPDVLRGVLGRDIASSMEQAAAEQLIRFRKRWGNEVERKLDGVVQCLHSLYMKVGLPPRGTLSTLLPAPRQCIEFEDLT